MRAEEFLDALNEANEIYIIDAWEPNNKKRPTWRRFGTIAACLALLCASVLYLSSEDGGEMPTGGSSTGQVIIDQEDNKGNGNPAFTVHMDSVAVNEVSGNMDAARLWRDPEMYHNEVWDESQIIEYYGRDLTPSYVPEGLLPAQGNGSGAFILNNEDGTVAEDTVWIGFYHDYYEDGSPKLTEGVSAVKGISITVSRIGILNCCIYTLPDDEIETTDIAGTTVTFGYRSMSYGPYDPDTHEPSGYYDLYTAEFTLEGVEYEIISHQLPLEEIVKVTASLITGEDNITAE